MSTKRFQDVLAVLVVLCVLSPACSRDQKDNGAPNDSGSADSDSDTDTDTDVDSDTDSDTGTDVDGGCDEPTPAEQAALDAAVQAYLTGADDTLLETYDAEFGGLCFDAVARAIRGWPLTGDLPAGAVVDDTYEAPLLAGALDLQLYVASSAVIDGTARAPLIVWLHYAGGIGVISPMLIEAAELLGGIAVAPSAPPSCDWSADEECASQIRGVVGWVKARYPVDHDRVYLSGFSMGGRGSFTNALAYPDAFAGVLPVAGSIGAIHGTLDPAVHAAYVLPHVENGFGQRAALITGLADNEYLVAQNTAAAGAYGGLGYDFEWIALDGVGHALPEAEWQDEMAWIGEKARDPYPVQVVYNQAELASSSYDNLFFNETWKTNAYWVRIDARVDDLVGARVKGATDGSTITIETQNVAALSVLLADEVVDLDAPISILVDGVSAFDGIVARDPLYALAHAAARDERSMVFANEVSIELP
jgi:dienelactone hydrolase